MTTSPPEIIPAQLQELISRNNDITIERCAQVAEGFDRINRRFISSTTAADIAAAIRKLKNSGKIDPNIVYPGKDPDFVFPEEEK